MANRRTVATDKACKPIGPYSVGIVSGDLVFASGMLGLDPQTQEMVQGGIEAETRRSLTNLAGILEAAGSSMDLVLKTTVYLRDIADFPKMNAVYTQFFPKDPPARSTVQVAALPAGGAIEIDAVARTTAGK
jgi:2-iminobutanoate/2-iminopropanoate deaminase